MASTLTFAQIAMLFAITWAIGLSAPLIIRFGVIRHPLSWRASNGIAFGWSAIWWLSFSLISVSARDGQIYHGVVWLLLFFVNRWLLNRGRGDAPVREPRSWKQRLFGLPTWDKPDTSRRLSRQDMVNGLENMLANPKTSPERRQWAADRLAKLRPPPA